MNKIQPPAATVRKAVLLFSPQKNAPPTAAVPPRKSVGVFPQDAITVKDLLQDNRSAFRSGGEGRVTFEIGFTSTPTGARIYYKKMIDDDYKDYPGLTDVQRAEFDLATTDFLFRRDGCKDPVKYRLDPYQGPDNPVLPVVFHNCKRR